MFVVTESHLARLTRLAREAAVALAEMREPHDPPRLADDHDTMRAGGYARALEQKIEEAPRAQARPGGACGCRGRR